VPIPYDRRLQDLYVPSTLSGDEYPNMLGPGETIDTIATSVLLVSFNWPEGSERYRRTANFVNALFSKFDEFRKPPRHPKWAEASVSIKVPGWERFKAVDDWLAKHLGPSTPTAGSEAFNRFLSQNPTTSNLSAEERAVLFQKFLEWQRTQPSSAPRRTFSQDV
jgi:hypothetical protein